MIKHGSESAGNQPQARTLRVHTEVTAHFRDTSGPLIPPPSRFCTRLQNANAFIQEHSDAAAEILQSPRLKVALTAAVMDVYV